MGAPQCGDQHRDPPRPDEHGQQPEQHRGQPGRAGAGADDGQHGQCTQHEPEAAAGGGADRPEHAGVPGEERHRGARRNTEHEDRHPWRHGTAGMAGKGWQQHPGGAGGGDRAADRRTAHRGHCQGRRRPLGCYGAGAERCVHGRNTETEPEPVPAAEPVDGRKPAPPGTGGPDADDQQSAGDGDRHQGIGLDDTGCWRQNAEI